MRRHGHLLPAAWSGLLAVLLLGPALGPGYVLNYDMVWVPQLSLRPEFLGLGSGLPRAVPSDALVAVLDNVVPGMVLQKVILLCLLIAGGAGAAALVDGGPMFGRLTAATFYVWNPFVAERLGIGHWPLLAGYATLPWLVVASRRSRHGRPAPYLGLLLLAGSLSASAGILTAITLACLEVSRGMGGRRAAHLGVLVLCANAPWLAAGMLHASNATSSALGARVFALHGEGSLPAPLTALGLGGIWNAEVVPATRTGSLAVVALLVLMALAGLGFARWRRRAPHRERAGLVLSWALGVAWAVGTWAFPGASAWLASHVPGGGVMRDGGRALALCAPLLAALLGHGVTVLAGSVPGRRASMAVGVMLALAPVALMPDVVWGLGGRLGAVDYPRSFESAREVVGGRGDVLLLPLASYRAPRWNEGRPVLDPMARYLRPDVVSSDVLVVDGRPLPGEDPRARAAQQVLESSRPSAALAALGIRTVVIDAPTGRPAVPVGRQVMDEDGVAVRFLAGVRPPKPGTWPRALVASAWAAYLICAGIAVWRTARARVAGSADSRW